MAVTPYSQSAPARSPTPPLRTPTCPSFPADPDPSALHDHKQAFAATDSEVKAKGQRWGLT